MANGKCSRCEVILTEENSSPSIFKPRKGLCRECSKQRWIDTKPPAKPKNKKQTPGQEWTFINKKTGEKDTGILPPEFGGHNDFAQWQKHPEDGRGGHWSSQLFRKRRNKLNSLGLGPAGFLGTMRHRLSRQKEEAKAHNFSPPETTPEQMVLLWESQKGMCIACGSPIDLVSSHFDHNHETGKARGFIHGWCNSAEGMLNKMSDIEFLNFIEWFKTTRGN